MEAVLAGQVDAGRVVTHRLVTDAHPLALARRHGVRLATLDREAVQIVGAGACDVVLVRAQSG